MPGIPPSTSALAQMCCIALLGTLAAMACARSQSLVAAGDAPAHANLIAFDIPAQSLDSAVKTYAFVTGLSVLASSDLLRPRMTTALHGTYTPRDALNRLLAGTGLSSRFVEADTVGIFLSPAPGPADAPLPRNRPIPLAMVDAVQTGSADYRPYIGRIQAQMVRALCRSPLTRPGRYRYAVRIQVADDGAATVLRHSGTPEDPDRDEAIDRVLNSVKLEAPPLTMPRSLTILLRPDGDGVITSCPANVTRGE